MNKNIKIGDRVSAEVIVTWPWLKLKKIRGVLKGFLTDEPIGKGIAEVHNESGCHFVAPSSLRRLVKKKKPETFTTSKGFVFTKTPLGWIDETSRLEWMNEFKAGINHYDSEIWAADQKMRQPTREEFIEAESHGIRELPGMTWKGYWFWSSTPYPGDSGYAYGFYGASGYAGGSDVRDDSYSYVAARAVRNVCP